MSWKMVVVIALVAYAFILAEHAKADEPVYKLQCDDFVEVSFYDNGDLNINGVDYPLTGTENRGQTLKYGMGVELTAKRVGNQLMIDDAVLFYQRKDRQCHVTWEYH